MLNITTKAVASIFFVYYLSIWQGLSCLWIFLGHPAYGDSERSEGLLGRMELCLANEV